MSIPVLQRRIHKLDASGRTLGRLATSIARLLQGKHKATYAANRDVGDVVLVKNLHQVLFTGKKQEQKVYFHYSGYPGGIRKDTLSNLWNKDRAAVLRRVVTQMLPATTLRKKWLTRLRVED